MSNKMQEYTILKLERKNNSVNGNPKYEVYFLDSDGNFDHATTKSDASFCYGITNGMYTTDDPRVVAQLSFNRTGKIDGYKLVKQLREEQ